MSYGLSTVRPYQAKRIPDDDYIFGQSPGRGMGAFATIEMSETRDMPLTTGLIPAIGGQRRLAYPVRLHVYHLAREAYTEDAEADVDDLDQAIHELLYSDPTLGGICFQAGISAAGIRTLIYPAELRKEMTLTTFTVDFDAEVQIVV